MSVQSTTPTQLIYLDANATTPVLPRIAQVVSHTMQEGFGNPSSSHITGVQAKHLMEQTRTKARQVIGAQSGKILFTSGATEGIQTAVVSALVAKREQANADSVLLYGATEHKAVPNTLIHWNNVLGLNAKVLAIPVDENGLLDTDFIAKHAPNALMICTMAVNNETGVYQDLAKIEQAIRQQNPHACWMVDCVQALGKQQLNISQTSIDYAPFSGHKLYAPKGIGFLYIRESSPYTPFIAGGGQESGMRSGTENLPGIAGLNELFTLLLDTELGVFHSSETLHGYRQQLIDALSDTFGELTFNHPLEGSVPTTLNFAVNELSSKEVMDLFDAASIRVSGGSACSSGAARSFVLDAMQKPSWQSENAIRLSFGPAATAQEIDLACERIRSLKAVLANNCLIAPEACHTQHDICAYGLTQFRHQHKLSWLYVSDNQQAVIINPQIAHVSRFEKIVKVQQLNVVAVLNTHDNEQQNAARHQVAQKLGLTDNVDTLGWPVDKTQLTLGNKQLIKLATAGISPEGQSYVLQENGVAELCFCGELMVWGGLGNTQHPHSDNEQMAASLILLNKELNSQTVLCPAYDYQQCFAMNWQSQVLSVPLLAELIDGSLSTAQFAEQKQAFDKEHLVQQGHLAGFIAHCEPCTINELSQSQLHNELHHSGIRLLDVREPYEHDARAVHQLFDVPAAQVVNIPLSRLANALCCGALPKNEHYILLCRTGNRSAQAAKNLRLLGYEHVFNLQGGLALV